MRMKKISQIVVAAVAAAWLGSVNAAEGEKETLERLEKWGFNMLGTGADDTLRHCGMVHAWEINFGNRFGKAMDENDERWIMPGWQRPCSALPNVFHPDFESYCDKLATETCAPLKDDKDLLGWFLDNELAWWGKGPWGGATGTYDACMAKPETHSARKAAEEFTAKHPELKGDALKTAFLELVAERFGCPVIDLKSTEPEQVAARLGAWLDANTDKIIEK